MQYRNLPRPRDIALGAILLAGTVAFVSCGAAHTSEGDGATRGGPSAQKLALLVGINSYERQDKTKYWRDLKGCVGDVMRVRRLLIERFRFPREGVLVLTNEKATHRGIVEAFARHLIARAGPETEVVFYYAGHGARAKDASGRVGVERDGMDSTYVAYDSRAGKEPFDLTDDELHSLLVALCKKTRRVTVITDSCHSGGATRGADQVGLRSAEELEVPISVKRIRRVLPVPFLEDGDRAREKQPYVHLAACGPSQGAGEQQFDVGRGRARHAGVFSWFLAEALETLGPGASYEQLAARLDMRMATRRRRFLQRLEATGDLQRRVFAADFAMPLPGWSARLEDPRRILVDAGSLQLLREGSSLKLTDLDAKELGRAEVFRASEVESEARWVGKTPRIPRGSPMRAIEIERPAREDPLVVGLPVGRLGDALDGLLAKLPRPRIKTERALDARVQYRVVEEGGEISLVTRPTGLVLWRAGEGQDAPEAIARALATELEREAQYLGLCRLAEHGGPVRLRVEVDRPTDQEMKSFFKDYHLVAGEARPASHPRERGGAVVGASFSDGPGQDIAVVRVRMPPEGKRYHVAVLSLGEDRSIHLLYPGEDDAPRENQLAPGEVLRRPVVLKVGAGWPRERPMRDRYLVVATRSWVGWRRFVQGGRVLGRAQARAKAVAERATRGREDAPLPELLRLALLGEPTRGEPLRSVPRRASFGIVGVDIRVWSQK